MATTHAPEFIAALNAHGVSLAGCDGNEVRFMFVDGRARMQLEPCIEFRTGAYEIGRVGAFTYLGGRGTILRWIASIGRFCSIAADVMAGQVEHPTDLLTTASCLYQDWSDRWPLLADHYEADGDVAAAVRQHFVDFKADAQVGPIRIGNDVWIGHGAFIARGITIGDGAVIGARAVVTRDVAPYAVVAGVPARVIRYRFRDDIIARLQALRWWDYGTAALAGVDIRDIEQACERIERNIDRRALQPWQPPVLEIGA